MKNVKFAIFGDCGSQGILDNKEHTRAVGFINWYSLMLNPLQDGIFLNTASNIEMSPYSIRNLKLDLRKTALEYLLEEKADYLLIDPNDCRMEMALSHEKSGYTISGAGGELYDKLKNCSLKKVNASEIALEQYEKAAKKICSQIKSVYKMSEIILHVHRIVEDYTDGNKIGKINNEKYPARKKSVQKVMNQMYDILRKELEGCHVIEFPDYVLADSRHKFGLCGLHYHALYYEYGKAAIKIICENHIDEKMLLEYLRDKYSLKFRMLRDEIENTYHFSVMESRIDNLIKAFNNEGGNLKYIFQNITDARVYFDAINLYKYDIGIFIAVRDTPGFIRATNNHKDINLLGFENYPDKLWFTYCGFMLKGVVVLDVVSDIAEKPTIINGVYCNHSIHMESHSWRKSNLSKIMIDDVDYSSNGRGANIVIINVRTFEVIDSVVYDTHDQQDYFRRIFNLQKTYIRER